MTSVTLSDEALLADTWLNSTGGLLNPVINFAHYRYPFYQDIYFTNTTYTTPVSITYTPRFANSLLLVEGCASARYIQPLGMSAGIYRDGINTIASYHSDINFAYKADRVNHHTDMHCHVVVPANTTLATTFAIWLRPYDGQGEWFAGLGGNYIQIWEIQQ